MIKKVSRDMIRTGLYVIMTTLKVNICNVLEKYRYVPVTNKDQRPIFGASGGTNG